MKTMFISGKIGNLAKCIIDDTSLVCIKLKNNKTGVINDPFGQTHVSPVANIVFTKNWFNFEK